MVATATPPNYGLQRTKPRWRSASPLKPGMLGGREFMSLRKPYDESFRIAMVALGLQGVPIPTVARLPRPDDEILGPSLFHRVTRGPLCASDL